jgi:hypothetical protein
VNSAVNAESSETSLRTLLVQLWSHLSRRRRAQLGLLVVVMFASSAAEVLSLAAVVPFLAVLATPSTLWNQPRQGAAAADHRRVCACGNRRWCDSLAHPLAEWPAGGGDRFGPEL